MRRMSLRILILSAFFLVSSLCHADQNTKPKPFQLEGAAIADVQQAMLAGQLSCVELVNDYLDRIRRYDLSMDRGAPINAIAAINPSVLQQAQQLDEILKTKKKLVGPLHCIPVVVKDNIDSFDSPSTSGSLSMLGSQPNQDAFIVDRLRQAGALILAKGAMDEFASGASGISSRSGRVGNAFAPTESSGGSSAGPAAAVSANFTMLGLGTDNSGSVRIPAAFNGIYGLRPSTGLLSQQGIFPRGNLDGVAGPMARNVKDLAIMLSVMAAEDAQDPKTQSAQYHNYLSDLTKNALRGKRIGVVTVVGKREVYRGVTSVANNVFNQAKANLQKLGATLVPVALPEFDANRDNNMAGDDAAINQYLAVFPSTRQSFTDICESNRTRTFGKDAKACLEFAASTAKKDSKEYQQALATFSNNRQYVDHVMKKQRLDALLIPISTHGSATYDLTTVNTWQAPISSNSGLPAIAFVAGFTEAETPMPVGMELVGKMYHEAQLIGMAYAYEQRMTATSPALGEQDLSLIGMTIPELNNLFTMLGFVSYQQVLENGAPDDLTAKKFNAIVTQVVGALNS